MLNFYSCGCTARGDIPILSRCGEHNGHVVALIKDQVVQRKSFKVDNLWVKHQPLKEVLNNCIDKKILFDVVCSYPEHGSFYAHDALVEDGWRRKINPILPDLYSILKDDGHLVFIVEQTLLARLLYDGLMAGFTINSVSITSSLIAYEPYHTYFPEMYVYKFAVVFSKLGGEFKLPEYIAMSKIHRKVRKLKPDKLFETSCIHTPFLSIAKKTLGVCENPLRYFKLKKGIAA